VLRALDLFVAVNYNQSTRVNEDVNLQFIDAGHIIGSASVHLTITEKGKKTQLSFSGDVGQYGDMLLRAPQKFPQADYLILESTYGNRLHQDAQPTTQVLLETIIHTCISKKGKLIIPAFSVGRTQEILYVLNNLELEGKLPKVNVYVDSPLSAKATRIIANHAEGFNADVKDILEIDDNPFHFKGLHFIDDVEESKALNESKEACVIISASGMAEAGRVKHHIKNAIGSEKNTILMVGYCEPQSLGGRLLNGEKQVNIYGDPFEVVAEVKSIQSMSAHGDYIDLLQFISCQDPTKIKTLFLVHGEYEVQKEFKQRLVEKGFGHVEIPDRHEAFELN
jgi:metallo-beta-lactamase family protein